jgi:hypothetical protein
MLAFTGFVTSVLPHRLVPVSRAVVGGDMAGRL